MSERLNGVLPGGDLRIEGYMSARRQAFFERSARDTCHCGVQP
jgi:hypothetical protein